MDCKRFQKMVKAPSGFTRWLKAWVLDGSLDGFCHQDKSMVKALADEKESLNDDKI